MEDPNEKYLLKTPRTREKVLELWTQAKLQYANISKGITVPEFTCVDCATVFQCQFAFDLYNTNGDCLMEK